MEPESVLRFWFSEIEPKQWFRKDEAFDWEIARRFGELHEQAAACELFAWRESARGRLAEVLVLDQFSRNLFRGSARAFAQDPLALALAQEAVARGSDRELTARERVFLYMPYMHSESRRIHNEAVVLFDQPGMADNLTFEHRHREIIERFGRYPHRNDMLGRPSTEEELAFLQRPGSSF